MRCGRAPTPRRPRWQGLLLRASAGPCDSHAPEVVMVDGPMSPNEFGEAFNELLVEGGGLTRSLLGAQVPERN